MVRRWLIRVPCLLALAFVVGVWVMTYFGGLQLIAFIHGRLCSVGAVQGVAFMCESNNYRGTTSTCRFTFERGARAKEWLTAPDFWVGRLTWGALAINFPLWLPTALLVALDWFVWRKTRSKGAGRGFPVEPAAATDAPARPGA